MTLEQQISSLNENVGNLVVAASQLTDKVENKLREYEVWKGTLNKANPVILKVGSDKEFKHPVDAATRIASHSLAGDVLWRIEIDPGIYEFPYKGFHEIAFSYSKNVHVIGLGNNPNDTIFRYVGDEHHYILIAERNSTMLVRNISLRGNFAFTADFVTRLNNRSLRSGMPGAGLAHGILARWQSSVIIDNCTFYRLWAAAHCHDGSKLDIFNVSGSELQTGCFAAASSRIEMTRVTLSGFGPYGVGLGSYHCSSVFGYGVIFRNFWAGVQANWNSDFHFHQTLDYAADGITPVNVQNGLIENCVNGINIWHYSGGNTANLLIRNSSSHAIVVGQSSNVHAATNVTVDGADIGYYVVHSSALIANDSIARNCRGVAYYSANKSELHAANTIKSLSGNVTNYSPSGSGVLGNTDSLAYIS
jgi:hypothetical protein